MSDGRDGHRSNGLRTDCGSSIDELLDRAVAAINRGDRASASALAAQVLAVDGSNADAEGFSPTTCSALVVRPVRSGG